MPDALRIVPDDEASLLARLRGDDESAAQRALTEILARYGEMIRSIIWNVLHDGTVVDDLSQDMWSDCWKKRKTLTVRRNLPAYLASAARNLALSQLRTDQRDQQRAEKVATWAWIDHQGAVENDAEYRLAMEETGRLIAAFTETMPPRRREVYQRHLDGYTNGEIAEELKMSVQTVNNHMWQASIDVTQNLQQRKKDRRYA